MTKLKYLVLDIETTGLDPKLDGILEIGCVAIDSKYRNIGAYSAIVSPAYAKWLRLEQNPFVKEMHHKSGLDLAIPYGLPLGHVDANLFDWLVCTFEVNPRELILAGHTIAFDHRFVKEQMPLVGSLLHHRSFDYSAIGVELNSLGYSFAFVPKDQMPHRGLPDAIIEQRELETIMQELRRDRQDAEKYRRHGGT